MAHSRVDIHEFSGQEKLFRSCAELLIAAAARAIAARGRFLLVLSGGGTPKGLYSLLGEVEFRRRVEWEKVFIFWGDERLVAPDHPQSNFRMARETLLDAVSIPRENVIPMPTGFSAERGAKEYAARIAEFAAGDMPVFDLILLGVGSDGHTASLFPGDEVLGEERAMVAAVERPGAQGASTRLTMTLPLINRGANVWFLVVGASKEEIFRRVISGDKTLPAALVRPVGHLRWFVCLV